jgi:nucleoside transporter
MLLEYAIWGAWAPVLGGYLSNPVDKGGLGFSNDQLGWIYSMLPLASIIAPFIAGHLADRVFSTERFLGMLQLLGGAAMFVMARQTQYQPMLWWMLGASLLYAPTLALTNSLAFSHMRDSEREFGGIRVFGTLGWILSGLLLTLARNKFPEIIPAHQSDCLLLAGAMSIVLGILSFGLPHTPPKKEGVNPLAFVEALKLLKNRNFLVFVLISFVVATELQFYYILTSPFLEKSMGIAHGSVPGWMTLAQIAEIVVMAVLLPWLLPRMGLRKTMVVGIIAWPIRYIVFALAAGVPSLQWLVLASLTLHGFCYVFFFTVGFIYVDTVAHEDIRASAQSLIALVVLGVGSYVGSIFTGKIGEMFTNKVTNITDWRAVFLVPCALTIVCALVFPFAFRENTKSDEAAAA